MSKVYISAPFRVYTNSIDGREYGVLDNEKYMELLEDVETTINNLGFDVYLPHRDEGQWGNVYIEPDEVTEICFNLIKSSDILVVFPGNSRGVHIEVGYAAALGKKFLVLLEKNEKESTLLKGISRVTEMKIFRYNSTGEIFTILNNEFSKMKG